MFKRNANFNITVLQKVLFHSQFYSTFSIMKSHPFINAVYKCLIYTNVEKKCNKVKSI